MNRIRKHPDRILRFREEQTGGSIGTRRLIGTRTPVASAQASDSAVVAGHTEASTRPSCMRGVAARAQGRDPLFLASLEETSGPVGTDKRLTHLLSDAEILDSLRATFPSYAGNFEPEDYLHAEGSASQALLCVDLFFPALTELNGSVFLKQAVADPRQRDEAQRKLAAGHAPAEIEASFNRQELAMAFRNGVLRPTAEAVLAKTVARSWEMWLPTNYPRRSFEVAVLPSCGPDVTTVTFNEVLS